MPSANVGEKSIVQYQNTGTPKPLANSTECHAAWENPNTACGLRFDCQNANRKENANAGPRSQLIRNNEIQNQKFHSWRKRGAPDIVHYRLWSARQKSV